MINQTFQPRELLKCVNNKDITKYLTSRTNHDVEIAVTLASYQISQEDFEFKSLRYYSKKPKKIIKTNDFHEFIAIKSLNNLLRRVYRIPNIERNEAILQIKEILSDGVDYEVIKIDLKNFYEEIPLDDLITNIRRNNILGSLPLNMLSKVHSSLLKLQCTGLPRGLAISSSLSEIYMFSFDRYVKSLENVYFYTRYVDDIIIVCQKNSTSILEKVKHKIQEIGLQINENKSSFDNKVRDNLNFDYLGLNFHSSSIAPLEVKLSQKKVKSIKTRIIKAIVSASFSGDYDLLADRILYLASNHKTSEHMEKNLCSGIYYSNIHINSFEQLNDLNTFLRKSLSAKKGSLARKVNKIPKHHVNRIIKICFFKGYIEKKMVDFTPSRIKKITECWKK